MNNNPVGRPALRRNARLLVALGLLLSAATPVLADQQAVKTFAIGSQPLASALRAYAEQTGDQVVFFSEVGKDKVSTEVNGKYTNDAALARMLAKSGLKFERLDAHTIAIGDAKTTSSTSSLHWSSASLSADQTNLPVYRTSADVPAAPPESSPQKSLASGTESPEKPLEEIVVTGTHIRGEVPAGSEVHIYSHEQLKESGAGTVDQFARQMTENFSGADTVANTNTNIGNSRFNGGGINNGFQGSSFDLHGLGPSATLSLLNGHRLAPGGFDGSLVDISQIPLSAVDHIEVLADGASAIYGADAVAGVVNVVTRKDFSGAETQLRYANTTDGGGSEYTGSQLLGHAWGSGNALINYEYDRQNGLDASERDYIPDQGGANLLIPRNRRNSLLATASQNLASQTNLSVSGIFSDREYHTARFLNSDIEFSGQSAAGRSRLSGATAALDQGLWGDWQASLSVNYSSLKQNDTSLNDAAAPPVFTQHALIITNTSSQLIEADLLANGSLFTLPAGAVKAAVGGSYRHEKFDSSTYDDINNNFGGFIDHEITTFAIPTLHRNVESAYGELAVPLISAANALPGARRLELSLAVRYDRYSDFGSTTNPKVGLVWEPVAGFDVRGTYGKSYRAPQLYQLGALQTYATNPIPNPASPTGVTDTLLLNGGNLNLRPERATSYTAGFDIKPALVPDFNFSATYYHIAFHDRIATPPISGGNIFGDPVVASFLTLNPPLSLVESYFKPPGFVGDYGGNGPGDVQAIFDNRLANIVTSHQSGVDLTSSYSTQTDYGRFGASLGITRLIDYTFQAVPGQPDVNLANTYGEPVKWKGRGSVRWSDFGLTSMLSVNWVGSYENTLFTPATPIGSWVTEDLYLGYDFGAKQSHYALRNLRFDFTIQNLTDKRPPYATLPPLRLLPGENPLPYDSANASPIGRLISIQVAKRW